MTANGAPLVVAQGHVLKMVAAVAHFRATGEVPR